MTDSGSVEQKFRALLDIMSKLRDPTSGCPWDLAQDFTSIAPYTIEEAYEVADAIARDDIDGLKDELGDLALQVVFHAQMATEMGRFDIGEVLEGINAKMIRRHPHIFSDMAPKTSADVAETWEAIKATERQDNLGTDGALDGVALALPALMRAQKLAKRAARTGFDWVNPQDIFSKLDEETAELQSAIANDDKANIEEELGDMLFVVANLCRRLEVDAETALRNANNKFQTRFEHMEALARASNRIFGDLSLTEQEALWQDAKKAGS